MPRPPGTSGFEVTPRAKIDSRSCSGTPGPESVTMIVKPSSSSMCHDDRRRRRPFRDVDGVVDEVAHQGDDVGGQRGFQGPQMRFVGDLQRHLAFRGQRGLGDQQRRHRGIRDSLRHRITDLGTTPVSVPTRSRTASYSPSCTRPEMVCNWLENSWVWARSVSVTLLWDDSCALHGRQFGAVAHGGHRADALTLVLAARRFSAKTRVRVAITRLASASPSPSSPESRKSATAGSRPTSSTRRPIAPSVRSSSSWRCR